MAYAMRFFIKNKTIVAIKPIASNTFYNFASKYKY